MTKLQKPLQAVKRFIVEEDGYLFSVPFVLSAVMLNLQFLFGLVYLPNIVYTTTNVLTATLSFGWAAYVFIKVWITNKQTFKDFIKIFIVILFFAACYGIAFLIFGLNSSILKQFTSFILFCPAALVVGALVAKKDAESSFFYYGEIMCVLALPLGIHYVMLALINSNIFVGGGIGFVNYMQLSYMYMPLLFVVTIQYICGNDFFIQFKKKKIVGATRLFCILVYWLLILGCGTRGTIVCVLVFFVFLVLYLILMKHNLKKVLLLGGILFFIFVLFSYVLMLPSMERLTRMNRFTTNLASGRIITSSDASFVDEKGIDAVVDKGNSGDDTKVADKGNSGDDTKVADKGNNGDDTQQKYIIGVTVKNRTTMFKLAWKEALKNPTTGLGPFGYTVKYGCYPHNIVLELLCELGFIAGGLMVAFVAFCFIRLAISCKRDFSMGMLLVFLCGYVTLLMVSGTVWAQPVLLFGMGYALCYVPKVRKKLADSSEHMESSNSEMNTIFDK